MSKVKRLSAKIGHISIGAKNEICLQSMTSTPTMDTLATLEQIINIIKAGAQFVRVTARDEKEAKNLREIQKLLREKGYKTPLIADIHFQPKAAIAAAAIVDKVRINPGNYVDTKKDKSYWSTQDYQNDLLQIKNRLRELVQVCSLHQTAIRIGVNHGSLSERIVNRYGNTARAMAVSALEFIHIFESLNFENLVISLKASNVLVMVDANKIIMEKMISLGKIYPIHLGVTEAGDAEDGRIKSAIGIGSLLSHNIGDTIRVSLTENPEKEIPVAREIVKASVENNCGKKSHIEIAYSRRKSSAIQGLGQSQIIRVISSYTPQKSNLKADYYYNLQNKNIEDINGATILRHILPEQIIKHNYHNKEDYYMELTADLWTPELGKSISKMQNLAIVLEKTPTNTVGEIHALIERLNKAQILSPLILKIISTEKDKEKLLIHSSVQAGPFLLKGAIDGIWIEAPAPTTELCFGILQATRQRMSKTDYIACPSCGRTLFNIQQKLQEIKKASSKFVGLKIAVMGCIVNGPGEMADADFGYVGAGPGKVNLYKGHQLIEKNIDEDKATEALLSIIRKSRPI